VRRARIVHAEFSFGLHGRLPPLRRMPFISSRSVFFAISIFRFCCDIIGEMPTARGAIAGARMPAGFSPAAFSFSAFFCRRCASEAALRVREYTPASVHMSFTIRPPRIDPPDHSPPVCARNQIRAVIFRHIRQHAADSARKSSNARQQSH